MPQVQRADPAARRQAILFVGATVVLGTVLVLAVDRYSEPLRDWVTSDPDAAPRRLKLLFVLFASAASAPLLAFATYLWRLGSKVVAARQFPPPDQRLVRDVEIVVGQAAVGRGRSLQIFAGCLGGFCLVFWFLLWRLAALVRPTG